MAEKFSNSFGNYTETAGIVLNGYDAVQTPGTCVLRVDPVTIKGQFSNNGSAWQDLSSGGTPIAVTSGSNINVTQDISGNYVISTVNSPSFTSITATDINTTNISSATTINLQNNTSITGTLTTSGLINTVNLASFKSDYDSKINQDVRNSASPSFITMNAVTVNSGTLTTSGSAISIIKDTNITGSLTTTGLINTVNLASFKSDYDSKVNQDVRNTASPTFNVLNSSSVSSSSYTSPSASIVLSKDTSISGALTTSSTINGVNLASFKSDYDSKVNQDVRTGASPTFAGTTIDTSSITSSGGYLRFYNPGIGFHFSYNNLGSPKHVYMDDSNGLYSHKITTPNCNVTSALYTPEIWYPSAISTKINTTEIRSDDLTETTQKNKLKLQAASDDVNALTVYSSASRKVLQVGNADGQTFMYGPSTAISGTVFRGLSLVCQNQNTTNCKTGFSTGIGFSTNNMFDVLFNYIGNGSASNYLTIGAYNQSTPALTVGATGYMEQGSASDFLVTAQRYQYSSGSGYRTTNFRLNSGNAPSGRNRLEFYGINGQYNAGATDPSGYLKTFGYTFQQQISNGGSYYDVLDIDYSGVKLDASVPLISNTLRNHVSTNVMYVQNNTATTTSNLDLYISNCTTNNTALQISPVGSTNNMYIKTASASTPLRFQSWISGSPVDNIILNNGLDLDYVKIGTNGRNVSGSLRTNSNTLQFYNGSTWTTLMNTFSQFGTKFTIEITAGPVVNLTVSGQSSGVACSIISSNHVQITLPPGYDIPEYGTSVYVAQCSSSISNNKFRVERTGTGTYTVKASENLAGVSFSSWAVGTIVQLSVTFTNTVA